MLAISMMHKLARILIHTYINMQVADTYTHIYICTKQRTRHGCAPKTQMQSGAGKSGVRLDGYFP